VVSLSSGPREFQPSLLGKAATAWFIVTCLVVMYFNWQRQPSSLVDACVWVAMALTVASSADYLWRVGRRGR
jgi:steroid 5-alpha reductase family enzyme